MSGLMKKHELDGTQDRLTSIMEKHELDGTQDGLTSTSIGWKYRPAVIATDRLDAVAIYTLSSEEYYGFRFSLTLNEIEALYQAVCRIRAEIRLRGEA